MPSVEESITINRKPEEVWDFLMQTENIPVVESQVVTIDQITDGPVAVGTRWKGTTKVLGRKLDWTTECVELEPGVLAHHKTVEATLPFEIRWQLKPIGDGTEVTYRIDAEAGLGAVIGTMADGLVMRAQRHTVRANLANLKELLEAEG